MAVYRISDILDCLQDLANDGFEYVDITDMPSDDDSSACLNVEAIINKYSSEGEFIDSVELPDNYECPLQ